MARFVPLYRPVPRIEDIKSSLAVRGPDLEILGLGLNYALGHGRQLVPAHAVPSPVAIEDGDSDAVFRYYVRPSPRSVARLWSVSFPVPSASGGGTVRISAGASPSLAITPPTVPWQHNVVTYLELLTAKPTGVAEEITLTIADETIGQGAGVTPNLISCVEVPRLTLDEADGGVDVDQLRSGDPGIESALEGLRGWDDGYMTEPGAYVAISGNTTASAIATTSSFAIQPLFASDIPCMPRFARTSERSGGRTLGVRAYVGGAGGTFVQVSTTVTSDVASVTSSADPGWTSEMQLDVATIDDREAPHLHPAAGTEWLDFRFASDTDGVNASVYAVSVYPIDA